MIEVTFRADNDIESVSAWELQEYLKTFGLQLITHPEGYVVHVHNLDVDDEPSGYDSVCTDTYTPQVVELP